MATMSEAAQLSMSWDGQVLAWYRPDEGLSAEECVAEPLPVCESLALNEPATTVLWYVEPLLMRNLHLPLKSAHLLDAGILMQELIERAAIDEGDWWLCWDFSPDPDGGIQGMVFGLPVTLQQQMQQDDNWQGMTHLGVDLWHRLQGWKDEGSVALLDEDVDGLCLGFYRQGCWQGMRRLNGSIDHRWEEALASLQSMGFDADIHPIRGHISEALKMRLQALSLDWQGESDDELLPRYHANLRTIRDGVDRQWMNFRHGSWAARGLWKSWQLWLRSGVLLLCVIALALVGLWRSNLQLEAAIVEQQQRTLQAFHLGLPKETTIIDPLAQLQRAAADTGQLESSHLLSDLQVIAEVFKSSPWQLKQLNLQRGKLQISGEIVDIKTLNKLQQLLQQRLHREVSIVDTNLGDAQLSFRLEWAWS